MRYIAFALFIMTVGCDGSAHSSLPNKTTSSKGKHVVSLTTAIRHGHYREVSDMLAAGADPNRPGERGMLPMTAAALSSDIRFLQVLIAHGGRVLDGKYEDAISYSVTHGLDTSDWSNYNLLISHTDSHMISASSSNQIINKLAAVGQFDKVLELLNKGYPVDSERQLRLIAASKVAGYGSELDSKHKVIELLEANAANNVGGQGSIGRHHGG